MTVKEYPSELWLICRETGSFHNHWLNQHKISTWQGVFHHQKIHQFLWYLCQRNFCITNALFSHFFSFFYYSNSTLWFWLVCKAKTSSWLLIQRETIFSTSRHAGFLILFFLGKGVTPLERVFWRSFLQIQFSMGFISSSNYLSGESSIV